MTPSVWREVPIGALYRRRAEANHPQLPLLSVYRDLGVVPREGREDNFNKPGEDLNSYQVVRPGYLVLNKMKTWQGSLGVSSFDGIVSPAYFVAEQVSDTEPRFIHHLLRSSPLIGEYGARSKGIRPNQWDLPWEEFRAIRVRLPSISDQRAISDYLDAETARIDGLVADLRKSVELLRERRRTLITEAVCAGITGNGPLPVSPSRALTGVALKRVCARPPEYGLNISPERYRVEGVRLLRTSDVSGDGSLDDDGGVFLDPADVPAEMELRGGDLLFSRSGTVGRGFLFDERRQGRATFAGFLVRFRLKSDIDPRAIRYWSESIPFMDAVGAGSIQSTISNFNAEKYANLPVPTPVVVHSRTIADYLDAETPRINGVMRSREQQIALLLERRQSLIAAAVTGQLDIPGVAA